MKVSGGRPSRLCFKEHSLEIKGRGLSLSLEYLRALWERHGPVTENAGRVPPGWHSEDKSGCESLGLQKVEESAELPGVNLLWDVHITSPAATWCRPQVWAAR